MKLEAIDRGEDPDDLPEFAASEEEGDGQEEEEEDGGRQLNEDESDLDLALSFDASSSLSDQLSGDAALHWDLAMDPAAAVDSAEEADADGPYPHQMLHLANALVHGVAGVQLLPAAEYLSRSDEELLFLTSLPS